MVAQSLLAGASKARSSSHVLRGCYALDRELWLVDDGPSHGIAMRFVIHLSNKRLFCSHC